MAKNKKKFRAEIYQKLLQESSSPSVPKVETPPAWQLAPVPKTENAQPTAVSSANIDPQSRPVTSIGDDIIHLVFLDVKKILITTSGLVLVVVFIYFIGLKTNLLLHLGDFLTKIFHITGS